MDNSAERNRRPAPRYRSRRQQAVVDMIHTADVVRRQFIRLLEPHGLTVQQYNVLRILRGARPDAVPTMVIAERMIEQTPGITRLLDRLDEKGLVNRERCAADRRQVLCTITAKGLELLAVLDMPIDLMDDAIVAGLEDSDVARLIDLLGQVRRPWC